MSHQDESFCFAQLLEAPFVDFSSNLRVNGRDGIVEDEDIRISVEGSSKSKPSFLPSREGDSFLSNDRLVPVLQDFKISCKAGLVDYSVVKLLFLGQSEEDVVVHCV
jgi:hypothetical protein